MKNTILQRVEKDSAYSQIVQLYSGLFDTQDERETFILEVVKKDVLLAAECKMSSMSEEEKLLDIIILDCCEKYEKEKDVYALFTLMKLEEYWIIDTFFFENAPITGAYYKLIKNNSPITDFIELIKNKIPNDILSNLLLLIKNNGYRLDLGYYKSILKLSMNKEAILSIYDGILLNDIKPDIEIINLLIKHSENENKATFLFEQIYAYNLIPNNGTIMNYCEKITDIITIKKLFHRCIKIELLKKRKLMHILIKGLQISENIKDINYFYSLYKSYIEQEINDSLKRRFMIRYFLLKITFTEYQNAIEYFEKSIEEIGNNIFVFSIFFSKIEEEKTLYHYVYKYKETLFSYNSTIKETLFSYNSTIKETGIKNINQAYNSILLTMVEKTVYEVANMIAFMKGINLEILEIDIYVIKKIFTKFSIKQFGFLLKYLFIKPNLDKSFFTSLINELKEDDASILFNEMEKRDFEFNLILYNVFVKKISDVDICMKIISQMRNNGFKPDKFTYSSMFQKELDASLFYNLIEMCSYDKISVDSKFSTLLLNLIRNSTEFHFFYKENSNFLYKKINFEWLNLIEQILTSLSNEKTIHCEIINIEKSRVFVKTENETRPASIYISMREQKTKKI